MKFSDSSDDDE